MSWTGSRHELDSRCQKLPQRFVMQSGVLNRLDPIIDYMGRTHIQARRKIGALLSLEAAALAV